MFNVLAVCLAYARIGTTKIGSIFGETRVQSRLYAIAERVF